MKKTYSLILGLLFLSVLSLNFNCGGRGNNRSPKSNNEGKETQNTDSVKTNSQDLIKKGANADNIKDKPRVYYYLENSGSMFGYVHGFTEYVEAVSELSAKSDFVAEDIVREFSFVNGSNPIDITFLGDTEKNGDNVLIDKLNDSRKGFKQGTVETSDLNAMFQLALEKAAGNNISILISDGIYDIQQRNAPRNALITKGQETKTKFIKRLREGDFQTLMIKLKSNFNGKYYYLTRFVGNKQESIKINQKRPYYIWIFGQTNIINKYFPDDYIKSLKGYVNHVRFLKTDNINIPYEITTFNRIGRFKLDRKDKYHISDVNIDSRRKKFQFSFVVDYSKLPLPDSYFSNPNNYICSGDYKVEKIKPLTSDETKKFTHRITLSTNRSPYGTVKVNLINSLPSWIHETDTEVETNTISEDKTFGFKILTKGISDAYAFINKNKYVTTFEFRISN